METASHRVARLGVAPRLRRLVLGAFAGAFLAVVVYGAVASLREAERLDDRRAHAEATRGDPVLVAGESAEAFRRFRRSLDPSTRFALVYGSAVDRDRRGFLRLFAGSYLYPAIAVDELDEADAVMVFGRPPPVVVDGFERVDEHDGIWLGKRRAP